jgi:hypothetical protein
MKNVLVLVLLIFATRPAYADPNAQASRPTASILHPGEVPIGSLGFPLGSCLTLEGHRVDGSKSGTQSLRIDTINGKRLDIPIGIWVDNVDLPPPEFRCSLKGYESARMLGVPPAVQQAAREAGRDISLPQAGWQVQLYFVALTHVALRDVVLDSDPVAAIRSALPERWTILKVEENAYPPGRAEGRGKAVSLGDAVIPGRPAAILVVVFIMPASYQDHGEVAQYWRARTTDPATIIVTTPTAEVYLVSMGKFSARGQLGLTDNIFKKLFSGRQPQR